MRFCVFSGDPLYKYFEKGELRRRYWNPQEMFDEVTVFSFCERDVEPERVQALVGGAKLEIVPIGPPSLFRLPQQYKEVREALRRLRPDLVRVHTPWHGAIGVRAATKLGIPVLLSLHTHYGARRHFERDLKLKALKAFEYYSIRRADAVLAVSEYVGEYARSMGTATVSVIYNRVYVDEFCPARQSALQAVVQPRRKRPVVLSVGRLDPPKNQECLIRAVAGLDVDLVLVGDGVNRCYLERLVADLDLNDRVTFRGFVPHAELPSIYGSATVFAIATHYEGFCIPVLEAMAAGLPVVASNTPPIPEILSDAGLLVEQTPDAFREGIGQLLGDPARARVLSAAARRRAEILDGSIQEEKESALYRSLVYSCLS